MTPDQEFYERKVERSTDPTLPSHVRERIERREIIHEGGGGKSFGLGALIVLLLVAVGGFLWWNSRNANQEGVPMTSTSTETTTGSYGTTDLGSTSDMTPAPTGGAITDNPIGTETGNFGIAIGSFESEAAAQSERARLNSLTDQPVSVSTSMADGVTRYQVVLGSFPTRAAADSAGRSLANSTSMSTWRVVPIQ